MAEIGDVAAYFCEHYPHKSELSKTRLTKLVYLADWKAAKELGRQITNIKWYFHNYGPYVDDVINSVHANKERFQIVSSLNHYGDSKLEIRLRDGNGSGGKISTEEKEILDDIISETSPLYWNAFIKHVYATDPIENSDRYRYLNLLEMAQNAKTNGEPT